jgi:hypothetical protein
MFNNLCQEDVFTMQQFADYCHVSVSTVGNYVRVGKLRAILAFNRILIPKSEIHSSKIVRPYPVEVVEAPAIRTGLAA